MTPSKAQRGGPDGGEREERRRRRRWRPNPPATFFGFASFARRLLLLLKVTAVLVRRTDDQLGTLANFCFLAQSEIGGLKCVAVLFTCHACLCNKSTSIFMVKFRLSVISVPLLAGVRFNGALLRTLISITESILFSDSAKTRRQSCIST